MARWKIVIEAWPHSSGRGEEEDQKRAGDRVHYFYVDADGINEALRCAHCFAEGMKRNPMVWQAPITGVYVNP